MRWRLYSMSGVTSSSSHEVVLCAALPPLRRHLAGVWQFPALRVPSQGRILLSFLSLSHTNNSCCFLLLYSPAPVESWKNTLFLGIDACFKLKCKECGFDDPDLGTGLAYMVNKDLYQKYLSANVGSNEPVSSFIRLFDWLLIVMMQITTCGPDLNAVNQAYTKYSQGYAVTSVAAISYHHAFVRPEGVVDLQKGER